MLSVLPPVMSSDYPFGDNAVRPSPLLCLLITLLVIMLSSVYKSYCPCCHIPLPFLYNLYTSFPLLCLLITLLVSSNFSYVWIINCLNVKTDKIYKPLFFIKEERYDSKMNKYSKEARFFYNYDLLCRTHSTKVTHRATQHFTGSWAANTVS